MYTCSCNVFTDAKAITGLAGDSVAAVYRCLSCRPRCGGCVFTIRKILDEVREEMGCDCAGSCPEDDVACPAVERAIEIVQHCARGVSVLDPHSEEVGATLRELIESF